MSLSLLRSVVLGGSLFAAGSALAKINTVPGEMIVKLRNTKSFMKDLKSFGVEYNRPINVSFGEFVVVKSLGKKSLYLLSPWLVAFRGYSFRLSW